MDRNDQQAIETLFRKLEDVERQSPPRDGESESFIRNRIAGQPAAPYYMAQTIVVQEQALNAAQARIEELEREADSRQSAGGGLLGSLFGGGQPSRSRGSVPRAGATQPDYGRQTAAEQPSPWQGRQGGGGGFLAGAAQTAMGVAGGVLLGNAIGGLFGANEAHAAQANDGDNGQDNQNDDAQDASADDFDSGGDFGDMDI